MKYLLILITLGLVGCGKSSTYDDEKKADLNKRVITLAPEPGSFNFGVVVQFKYEGDGQLEIQKADGTWDFFKTCAITLPDSSLSSNCVIVNESTTIKYRLKSPALKPISRDRYSCHWATAAILNLKPAPALLMAKYCLQKSKAMSP